MIKIHDLKVGDVVVANYEGKGWEGEVVQLDHDDKQICVDTGVQQFWFDQADLNAVPINDRILRDYNFESHENGECCKIASCTGSDHTNETLCKKAAGIAEQYCKQCGRRC